MQFKNAALAAASASTVAAAGNATSGLFTFGVLSIHSGSEVQYAGWSATQNAIWNLAEQKPSCDRNERPQFATFWINKEDNGLYLYSSNNPPNQLWVDRSGMGQGKMGYTVGVATPPPKNSERGPFTITDGHLQFDGSDFLACSGYDNGAYEIFVDVGIEHPAGNNCTAIAAKVLETKTPIGCQY